MPHVSTINDGGSKNHYQVDSRSLPNEAIDKFSVSDFIMESNATIIGDIIDYIRIRASQIVYANITRENDLSGIRKTFQTARFELQSLINQKLDEAKDLLLSIEDLDEFEETLNRVTTV